MSDQVDEFRDIRDRRAAIWGYPWIADLRTSGHKLVMRANMQNALDSGDNVIFMAHAAADIGRLLAEIKRLQGTRA